MNAANVSGRIAGDGSVEEFPVPESGSAPGIGDLTLGPDGYMWFTEPAAGRIDFESPSGGGPGILVLEPGTRPTGLATVENSIWTTLEATGGLLVTYPATARGVESNLTGARPSAITLGAEGSLWLIDEATSESSANTREGDRSPSRSRTSPRAPNSPTSSPGQTATSG